MESNRREIPGTPIFNGEVSGRGMALNSMCYSFNEQANRDAFFADQVGYAKGYGLDDDLIKSVLDADVLSLIEAGGSIYYLAKLTGILGWDMQDVGARQTGLSREDFQARLDAAKG